MHDPSRAFHVAGYEILSRLGTGGMGSVYIARKSGPLSFSKLVAIKRLHPHLELDEESGAMKRFGDEARIGALLRHPNIVDVLDFGRDREGVYIVMEYVHGVDLNALMRAHSKSGKGGIVPGVAARILSEVLRGLQAAHELTDEQGRLAPVVHRDLGLRNVLLSDRGEVKITDFGIALILEGGAQQSTATRGTFAYMSPEQARGEPLDVRSDIYSCGVVLYELLTGRRAIGGGSSVETLERARSGMKADSFDALSGPASVLRPILEQALAVDREQRYATADDFRAELDRYLEACSPPPSADDIAALVAPLAGSPPEGPPPTARKTAALGDGAAALDPTIVDVPPATARKIKRRTAGVAVIVLAALLVGAWFLLGHFASRPRSAGQAAAPADLGVDRARPEKPRPSPDATPRDAALHADARIKDAAPADLRRVKIRKKPPRPKGWLAINTIPIWSSLTVDGKKRGTTPKRLRLTAGWHRVTLKPLGRGRAQSFKVRVRAGATVQKVIRVRRPPKRGGSQIVR